MAPAAKRLIRDTVGFVGYLRQKNDGRVLQTRGLSFMHDEWAGGERGGLLGHT